MPVAQPPYTLFLIFTIVVVVSIVVQMIVFAVLALGLLKAVRELTALAKTISAKALPLVGTVGGIVEDVRPKVSSIATSVSGIMSDAKPKISTITGHIVDITGTVRDQTVHVNTTVDDVVDKTKAQAAKVDDMVSAVLGSIAHAGTAVQAGVTKPVRQVGGVLSGIANVVETLFQRRNSGRQTRTASSETYVYDPSVPLDEDRHVERVEL
ncbi:hypothetical protein [Acidipila sp. EB88]|uniref:hypothetical protein n=1 Tax=Acidipila sp. EB88 TaxID=2305226 RepID=UPI000F5DADDB|nr:hypothetical protein [Acidipila sp. EB88]